MSYARIFVWLKIPDNIAGTAFHTLTHRMGFTSLQRLQRADFWEIRFPGLTPTQAQQTTERWVSRTALFMNPNKHRARVDSTPQGLEEIEAGMVQSGFDASILVCDRIDGKAESVLESIRSLTPEPEQPSTLRRGVWWDLSFTGLSRQKIEEAAQRMAVSVNRQEGLFANPHYQTHRIYLP